MEGQKAGLDLCFCVYFCVWTVSGGRDAQGYGRRPVLFFVEGVLLVLLVVELEALADADGETTRGASQMTL